MSPFLYLYAMKKIIILPFLVLFSLGFSQENMVEILGKTNVNSFKCTNSQISKPSGSFRTEAQLPLIQLKVTDFDCHNRMMTNDFRKILKAEQHPYFSVKFIKFTKASGNSYDAIVEVKIMNKKRFYNLNLNENKGVLSGVQTVRFSDFGIVPPRRMGGAVVVRDHLELNLRLNHF